jgi:hypothetical protein
VPASKLTPLVSTSIFRTTWFPMSSTMMLRPSAECRKGQDRGIAQPAQSGVARWARTARDPQLSRPIELSLCPDAVNAALPIACNCLHLRKHRQGTHSRTPVAAKKHPKSDQLLLRHIPTEPCLRNPSPASNSSGFRQGQISMTRTLPGTAPSSLASLPGRGFSRGLIEALRRAA